MSENTDSPSASSLFDDILDQSLSKDQSSQAVAEKIMPPAVKKFEDDVAFPETPEHNESASNDGLTGLLPPEAKKALVYLYRGGSMLMSQNKDRYDTLCKYEDYIRRHLADVYMDVIFDKSAGHIFTQILTPDDDDEEPARLVTAKPLSIYQSIILVVLRKYFQERETAGEQHIVIDLDRLESLMFPYLELSNSARKDKERLKKAVVSMVDKRLLIRLRGEGERFQISPIIRHVVNAELLENLLAEYQEMLEGYESGSSAHGEESNE